MKNLKALVITLLAFMLMLSGAAHARMYQWTEPETGSTQLSGKPPVWYRSESGGPRVFVFYNGHLVDDTAIEVSEDVREHMRQQALVLVEEDRQKAKDKIVKSQELKRKFVKEKQDIESNQDEMEQVPTIIEPVVEEPSLGASLDDDQNKKSDVEKTSEELRKMIEVWEKTQTENARKVLEQ